MSRNEQARWLGCFCSTELEKMEEDCTHYAMTLNYVKNSLYKKKTSQPIFLKLLRNRLNVLTTRVVNEGYQHLILCLEICMLND